MNKSLGLLVMALLLSLAPSPPVFAQERKGDYGSDHKKLHHWYKTLKKGYCCDDGDCRSTKIRPALDGSGKGEIFIDGKWCPLPIDKIVKNATPPDNQPHVCGPKKSNDKSIVDDPCTRIRCVVAKGGAT